MKKVLWVALLALACGRPGQVEVQVWTKQYLEPMLRSETAPEKLEKTIRLRVATGEYEPASIAVRSDRKVRVSLSLGSGADSLALPADWCSLQQVVSPDDSSDPDRLVEFSGPVELSAGVTQFFWFTVRPPLEAASGIYTGTLTVLCGSRADSLAIACEVLPSSRNDSPDAGDGYMARAGRRSSQRGWLALRD